MGWILMGYWACLALGVLYTVVAFALGGIGDAAGGDAGDAGGDFAHSYGVGDGGHGEATGSSMDTGHVVFGPFSPLIIAFFLTCFGGTGILFSRLSEWPQLVIVPIAAVSGFLLAWALFVVFNKIFGEMQSSSEVRLGSLLGSEAEVTVDIPAMGIGEIAYVAMGSRSVAPARSDTQAAIPRYTPVRVARIVGNMFFVTPVVEEQLRNLEPGIDPPSVTTVPERE